MLIDGNTDESYERILNVAINLTAEFLFVRQNFRLHT